MAKSSKKLGTPGITDEDGNPGSPSIELGSAPSAAEADAATKKAAKDADVADAKKEKEPPKRQLTSVPLRVFGQLSGLKPDQFRPFASYAVREDMRPCTVPEWKQRLHAFQNKPTPQLKRLAR